MHEATSVHGVQCFNQLRHVECGLLVREATLPLQLPDEVATLDELHDHIDILFVLEGREELHAPSAPGLRQCVTLSEGALYVVFLLVAGLVHLLQRIKFICSFAAAEGHGAEGALAEHLEDLEVVRVPSAVALHRRSNASRLVLHDPGNHRGLVCRAARQLGETAHALRAARTVGLHACAPCLYSRLPIRPQRARRRTRHSSRC
mmetsp:Transcript_88216/g.222096  ORF Transcript_88216/g.222096 Transcript_88216/m.222096 type:complete len:204 (-) Transcript_88216:36-647(-)